MGFCGTALVAEFPFHGQVALGGPDGGTFWETDKRASGCDSTSNEGDFAGGRCVQKGDLE